MSTLGQKPATTHVSFQKQTITGNGGTSYTLQQSVGSELDIAVFVNNTRQEPTTAYTASGTSLVMTGAVNSSDHFYVLFLAKAINTTGLPVSAVNTASINAGAVTDAKIAGMAASKLTGAMPALDGSALTGITNTPCFYATFSTNLNNQSNNTPVKVPFNSTTFNQGGGTFDTSNYRYTPGVAGVYQIGATVNMKDYNDDNNIQQQNVSIRKNGSDVYYNRLQLAAQSGSYGLQGSAYNPILTVLGLVQLDADDYVEVWASCYNANFDVHNSGSRFYGFKLLGTTA